jgi:hypothetical protein
MLTTEEVLAACAAEEVTVSVAQLGRWQRAGLLAKPQRRGRGRGRGWDTVWEGDTPTRAILIAHTLRSGRRLSAAAFLLLFKGLAPRGDVVQQLLADALEEAQRDDQTRQSYLDDPHLSRAEKRRRAVKATQRRFANTTPELQNALARLRVMSHRLVPPTGHPVNALTPYLSFAALQKAVRESDAETVSEACQIGNRLIDQTADYLTPFFSALLELMGSASSHQPAVSETASELQGFALDVATLGPLDFFRLIALLYVLALNYYGQPMLDALMAAAPFAVPLLGALGVSMPTELMRPTNGDEASDS